MPIVLSSSQVAANSAPDKIIALIPELTVWWMPFTKSNFKGEEWSDVEWFRMFVIIEHIFVVIFLGINRLISDTSKRVKLSMDRADYHFKVGWSSWNFFKACDWSVFSNSGSVLLLNNDQPCFKERLVAAEK